MSDLTQLEQELMKMLLDGDDPVLVVLREQLRVATVLERKMTGAGFYTDFSVSPIAPRCVEHLSFEIADLIARLKGAEHGAGFVLFIREGQLKMLEGFTFDEPWPDQITEYKLSYVKGQRDWNEVRQKLHGTKP